MDQEICFCIMENSPSELIFFIIKMSESSDGRFNSSQYNDAVFKQPLDGLSIRNQGSFRNKNIFPFPKHRCIISEHGIQQSRGNAEKVFWSPATFEICFCLWLRDDCYSVTFLV